LAKRKKGSVVFNGKEAMEGENWRLRGRMAGENLSPEKGRSGNI